MTNPIEQQARELLKEERARYRGSELNAELALRDLHDAALRAIVRALTPTGENAKHVEVLLDMADQEHLLSNEREAVQFAIRALSAPDNAEADDLDSFIAKQPQHIQEATERRYRELSADNAEAVCSCPSGEGSLRWPCAQHPPVYLNVWLQGAPSGFRAEEWFIAQTIYGDRVVLRALPKGHTYDFKTADNTYIARDKIAKWMPFPDSEFTPPTTRVTVSDEDIAKINRWLLQREKHRMAGDIHRAIYRLVKAVKGEK